MDNKRYYTIVDNLWKWKGKGAWFFVTVPDETSRDIHSNFSKFSKGWGTIPASITIGSSTWNTSLFWSKDGHYYLPVKAAVRTKEKLAEGDQVSVTISIDWMF